MADTKDRVSTSGLTEAEAKEFHSIFITSAAVFLVVAAIAHVLAYRWRPFWPGPNGWVASMSDSVVYIKSFLA
jgi:light-harvesting complex 1 beta chain